MSKREIVLNALFERLATLDVVVKRNDPLPQKIPDGGLVILRDGNVGEPEILLSPPYYIFTHRAEIEVIVQKVTSAERDQTLDNLLVQVGELLQEDPPDGFTAAGSTRNQQMGHLGKVDRNYLSFYILTQPHT